MGMLTKGNGGDSNCCCTIEKLYDLTLRANWISEPGNSVDYTYDGSNNVILAEFYNNGNLVFTQTFSYDGSNNCINITTT
jgi:hypothetical protein